MTKTTPSMAKIKIRKSLKEIIDKPINKTQKCIVREYFNNKCAYCDVYIDPKSRLGHFDHLLSSKDGGNNNIYNIVLACNICNGDEKREMSWQTFLKLKTNGLDDELYQQRVDKIIDWRSRSVDSFMDATRLQEMDVIIKEAIANFEKSVEKMRKLRDTLN